MLRRRLLIGGLILGAVVSLVAVPTIVERFADLGASSSPNGYATNSLVWRFDYWDQVLPLAAKDPITGIGLGMSSFETVRPRNLTMTRSAPTSRPGSWASSPTSSC